MCPVSTWTASSTKFVIDTKVKNSSSSNILNLRACQLLLISILPAKEASKILNSAINVNSSRSAPMGKIFSDTFSKLSKINVLWKVLEVMSSIFRDFLWNYLIRPSVPFHLVPFHLWRENQAKREKVSCLVQHCRYDTNIPVIELLFHKTNFLVNIRRFKVNNRSTRKRYEIHSMLTQWN